jgi:hypothetical protein
LDPSGAGWLGQLYISGSAPLEREVRGARCEDVVAALALITVLRYESLETPAAAQSGSPALGEGGGSEAVTAPGDVEVGEGAASGGESAATQADPVTPPAASNGGDETATPPNGDGEGATSRDNSNAEAPLAEAGNAQSSPAEVTAGLAASTETPSAAESASESTEGTAQAADRSADSFDASTGGGSVSAAADASVLAYVGYASVPSNALKALLRAELRLDEAVTSWSGALSLAYARGNDAGPDGTAELTLLTVELQLCPPGVSLDAAIWLQACADVRGGRLGLSLSPGERPLLTRDSFRPWAAIGPSLQAGALLSEEWTLRAITGFSLHLVRDSFEIARAPANETDPAPRFTLYQPAAVSIELLLGLGYAF